MSSFLCEHCGTEIIDSPDGYVTGCDHYPVVNQQLTTGWLSRDCQIYTGKCRCPYGQPICVPSSEKEAPGLRAKIAEDGRTVAIFERPNGDYEIEWVRTEGDVEVKNCIGLSAEALAATVAVGIGILERNGISIGPRADI